MRKLLYIFAVIAVLAACKEKKKQTRPIQFPSVQVPSMIQEPSERMSYAGIHFWDAYFGSSRNVSGEELERAMGEYASLLGELPSNVGREAIGRLQEQIDAHPDAYPAITELVSKYFYDPSSPLRSEELYLGFACWLSQSQLTPEGLRQKFEREATVCAKNAPGHIAEDFAFTDTKGRTSSLHGLDANLLVLIFGNPDCKACKDLMALMAESEEVSALINNGDMKVLSVYIDEDLGLWMDRKSHYPQEWINSYDTDGVIRGKELYCVRAVPSVYLLDRDKRVILKDATEDRLLGTILSYQNSR